MKNMKASRILSNTLIYVILIVMSIIWLAPLVWLVLQSFGEGGIKVRAQLIPEDFTFDNYLWLFSNFTGKTNPLATNHAYDGLFFGWFCNTLVVAILTCIINTIFVLPS
jgi:arabinogalactan oligomer/maltooligosaccharide transport system permease protein